MRFLITFFLSLCFLLLRGYDHVYAHTHHIRTCFSVAALSDKGRTGTAKSNLAVTRKDSSSDTMNDAINATETEDDEESISPRKFVEISNYFISFYYSQVPGDFYRDLNNRLPYWKHYSYTSSDIYIVQRVIRI